MSECSELSETIRQSEAERERKMVCLLGFCFNGNSQLTLTTSPPHLLKKSGSKFLPAVQLLFHSRNGEILMTGGKKMMKVNGAIMGINWYPG